MTGLSRLVAVDEGERSQLQQVVPKKVVPKKVVQQKSVISFYQMGALVQDNCFSSFFKTWSF